MLGCIEEIDYIIHCLLKMKVWEIEDRQACTYAHTNNEILTAISLKLFSF